MAAAPSTLPALDTTREVATPELIELRLSCAGPVARSYAYLIDLLIRLGVMLVASIILGLLGQAGRGVMLVLMFSLEWLYPVLFEVLWQGATPGKRALGLVVLRQNGGPIDWGTSITRNLLRTADFLPFLYGFGLVSMLTSSEFRRIGDIVAGSVVVYRDPPLAMPRIPEVPAWHPRVPLGRAAQRAVLAFAERAPHLSPARAEELAELAPQITGGAEGHEAVTRLYGAGRVLSGRNQ